MRGVTLLTWLLVAVGRMQRNGPAMLNERLLDCSLKCLLEAGILFLLKKRQPGQRQS